MYMTLSDASPWENDVGERSHYHTPVDGPVRCPIEQHRVPRASRLSPMKLTTVARLTKAEAILERIAHLAEQLALAPGNSQPHPPLGGASRNEAAAFRECLDTEQATATHDAKTVAGGSFPKANNVPRKKERNVRPRR